MLCRLDVLHSSFAECLNHLLGDLTAPHLLPDLMRLSRPDLPNNIITFSPPLWSQCSRAGICCFKQTRCLRPITNISPQVNTVDMTLHHLIHSFHGDREQSHAVRNAHTVRVRIAKTYTGSLVFTGDQTFHNTAVREGLLCILRKERGA